jgi:hypothetical protein
MKFLLPVFLLITVTAQSQHADFIVLKKHGKTIKTFFAGSDIDFTTTSNAYIKAYIKGIQHDSIYLQEFVIQYIPSTIGTYILDTVGSYHYQFSYHQIKAIGQWKKAKFDTKGSGASLLGGGALLTLASGVVYLADREKFSAPLMIASAGLATIGYFMAKSGGKGLVVGKKYKLIYMNMSNKKI